MKAFLHWLRSRFQPPPAREEAMKPVAKAEPSDQTIPHEHQHTPNDQDRDPRRALGRVRECAAGAGNRRSESAWAAADEGAAGSRGLEALPKREAESFIQSIVSLEHRNGAEHDVRFDPATRRVIKLTQPGEFGAWGGLEEYLQRLAWANEFFGDDIQVEGWVHYANEAAPRVVTTQPWYRVNPDRPEPTLDEIDLYMACMGWLKAYDGAWIHREREIVISDALPKNFVLDVGGYIQPIDLIILAPDGEQWARLQNMARSLTSSPI
jgi:hypothetical protein